MNTEQTITLKVSECRAIVVRCWDLLTPETRAMLQSIGINGGVSNATKEVQ